MKRYFWQNAPPTIIVMVILAWFYWFFNLDFLNQIQQTIQDFNLTDIVYSRVRNQNKVLADTNIILINIAKNRADIALQINKLNKYQPKIIGIDSFFRELQNSDEDKLLAEALSKVENLVMVNEIKKANQKSRQFDTVVKSHPVFTKNATHGYANFLTDAMKFMTVTKFVPYMKVPDKIELSFAVKIAQIYNKSATDKLFERDNEEEVINFRRNFNKFRTFDWDNILSDKVDLSFIKGKIVLLGTLGPDLKTRATEDNFYTPMNPEYVGKAFPDMYGVVINANIISMILAGDYIKQMPDYFAIIMTFLIVFWTMINLSFIRNTNMLLYEPASIFLVGFYLGFYFVIIILTYHWFGIDLNLNKLFFAMFVTVPVYELYNDSLKPLIIKAFNRIKLFKASL